MARTEPLAGLPTQDEIAARMDARLAAYRDNPNHPDLIGKPDGNPVQIRPAFPDAETFTERHSQGVQAATERYREGVRKPRANFKEAGLRAAKAWEGGVQAAVAEKAFEKGMRNVDADLAIETAATLGADSLVAGVTGRRAKIKAKAEKLAPVMSAAIAEVRAMPADTPQQREARAVAMIRAGREAGKKLRGA